jgi:hypothetical protein
VRIAAALLVTAAFPALGADPMATVHAYSKAFVDGDCVATERLSSESLRRRSGGSEGLREFICQFRAGLAKEGATLTEEVLTPTERFTDGSIQMVFVPIKRTVSMPKAQPVTNSWPYVVHSSNGGETWQVLDLACIDERWVKEIAPSWNGQPELPQPR